MYTYYYVNRPPGMGCQPDGWVEREDYFGRTDRQHSPYHGHVRYDRRLTLDEIYRYELEPNDLVEGALYHLRDELPYWINEYVEADPIEVKRFAEKHDKVAHWIHLLRQGGRLSEFLDEFKRMKEDQDG